MTFIFSRKSFSFTSPDGETLRIDSNFLGHVPAWVQDTWLFKRACAAGDITLPASTADTAVTAAVQESVAAEAAQQEAASTGSGRKRRSQDGEGQ